ncbi:STAS domain-containing protein [Streptomyces sp. NPDC001373]|uniref:STAS domain-containing protein n=1 Tax=Streptomyces sp. NPDC001373 TaxID=3364565 RepID=UPI00367D466D
MSNTLDLDVSVHGDHTVVTAAGELEMDTAPYLIEAADAIDLPGRALTLDLSAVTFFDSCGLNVLLALRHRASLVGATLELANLPDQALRLLDLTGTRPLFTLTARRGGVSAWAGRAVRSPGRWECSPTAAVVSWN